MEQFNNGTDLGFFVIEMLCGQHTQKQHLSLRRAARVAF
jgi:hypothetical protein